MTAMAFFGASVSAPIAEAGEVNGEVGTAATCYGQKKKYNISIGVGVTGLMRTTSHCDDINIQSINRNALARGCFYRKADPQELLYCGSLKTVQQNQWTVLATNVQDDQPFRVQFEPLVGPYEGYIAA